MQVHGLMLDRHTGGGWGAQITDAPCFSRLRTQVSTAGSDSIMGGR
jgi:hypothetical protein